MEVTFNMEMQLVVCHNYGVKEEVPLVLCATLAFRQPLCVLLQTLSVLAD